MSDELTAVSMGEVMPHNTLCLVEIISNGALDNVKRTDCNVCGRDNATQ